VQLIFFHSSTTSTTASIRQSSTPAFFDASILRRQHSSTTAFFDDIHLFVSLTQPTIIYDIIYSSAFHNRRLSTTSSIRQHSINDIIYSPAFDDIRQPSTTILQRATYLHIVTPTQHQRLHLLISHPQPTISDSSPLFVTRIFTTQQRASFYVDDSLPSVTLITTT